MFKNLLRTTFRIGVRAAVIVAAFAVGPFFALPALGSLVAGLVGARYVGKKVDGYMKASKEERAQQREALRGQAKSVASKVGRQTAFALGGWKVDGLPLDMTCDVVNRNEAVFGAAGIDGLIRASRSLLGKEEYSFDVPDLESATRLQSFIERTDVNGKVSRNGDGTFSVTTSTAVEANMLAKEAFPKTKVAVEREVVEGRQYIVYGAASYEDAMKKYQADPDSASYLGYYSSVRDTVDGVPQEASTDGRRIDKSNYADGMRVGAYVINVEDVKTLSGVVEVPANVGKESLAVYASGLLGTKTPGVSVASSERYAEGTPEGVSRYFVKDVDGHRVDLRDPSDGAVLAEDGLKAYVIMRSEDQVKEFVGRGTLPEGTFVSISADAPAVGEKDVVVELDLQDERVLRALRYDAGLPASVQVALDGYGVDPDTVSYSCLVDKVRRDGSVGLFLDGELGEEVVADSRFNGLRFGELEDRLTDERFVELGYERAMQWSREAAEINTVSIEIDVKNREMRISSSVGEGRSVKVERFPMTEEQLDALSRRGAITRLESKELLMQLHPDYFKTFSDGKGQSLFDDPLGAFYRGEKPTVKKEQAVTRQAAQTKTAAVKRQQTEKAAPKPRRKTKMGL